MNRLSLLRFRCSSVSRKINAHSGRNEMYKMNATSKRMSSLLVGNEKNSSRDRGKLNLFDGSILLERSKVFRSLVWLLDYIARFVSTAFVSHSTDLHSYTRTHEMIIQSFHLASRFEILHLIIYLISSRHLMRLRDPFNFFARRKNDLFCSPSPPFPYTKNAPSRLYETRTVSICLHVNNSMSRVVVTLP